MIIKLPVNTLQQLTNTEATTLFALLTYMNEDNIITVFKTELAKFLSFDISTITDHMKTFTNSGIITEVNKTYYNNKNNKQINNIYENVVVNADKSGIEFEYTFNITDEDDSFIYVNTSIFDLDINQKQLGQLLRMKTLCYPNTNITPVSRNYIATFLKTQFDEKLIKMNILEELFIRGKKYGFKFLND